MKKVVVGLSGGVDSSVCAYLLQEQGFEVIGMFMKNWHDESVTLNNECPWIDDSNDALLIAQQLGIPFQVIDLSDDYKTRIVDYMFEEYQQGRTPNPDVLCNREIKFDVFLKAAIQLGADFVATGHYCQKIEHADGSFGLGAGADQNKDQSYFLCQLAQSQLARALFPIGHLQKSEVRKIATEQGLITADKKDSQGLCFVGKISLPDFLQQKLKPLRGEVIEIPANLPQFEAYKSLAIVPTNFQKLAKSFVFEKSEGQVVAEHTGAHYFTIGQRKGVKVGGRPLPSFVIGLDTKTNIVYTGQSDEHPGLNRILLFIKKDEIHFISSKMKLVEDQPKALKVRIRYRQPLQNATLHLKKEGLYIVFEQIQKGITPGQFAAWYDGNELLGSGVIHS
jgi:tRNA-uridine 2-sulfurtransferase